MPSAPDLAPGHIGLSVTDLDRSIEFYTHILGLELIQASAEAGRRYAFLGWRGTLLLTLWQQSRTRFDAAHAGVHHVAFQVPTLDAVQDVESRLRARGLDPRYDGIVPHGEGADSAALYFEDPDGIRLEVCSPSGATGLAAPVAGAPSCGFF